MSLLIHVRFDVAVKNMRLFIVAMEKQQRFHVHCCRDENISLCWKHTLMKFKSACVCLYSCLRYPACRSHLFCAVLCCLLCPV
jgi:hypothetical protein